MKYLVPIDGSRDALAAVHHVVRLKQAGLPVQAVLVNVQAPPTLYEAVRLHDVHSMQQVRAEAGADLLAPAEATLSGAGIEWESEVAGGQAATLLLELAENYRCDAVVIGARGAGDEQEGGVGPVAQALVEHAGVPVTVVRG